MKKKIKLTIPKFISEVLEEDCDHFGISKERLCNNILLKLGYGKLMDYHKKMGFESKVILQFNLYTENEKYYKDISSKYKSISDSEMIRKILSTYSNMAPFLREDLIMDSKIRLGMNVIKSGKKVKMDDGENILKVNLSGISRCPDNGYLLISHSSGNNYISKVRIVKYEY